ncbi:MAG: cytochrome-c peroxidase [Pseudomonadales bacterium]|nr:cytochrome-c peroxidase [Pseudomonadales bacterium]
MAYAQGAKPTETRWSYRELGMLERLYTEAALEPPASPGNRFADNPLAAILGKQLFFDARLSGNGKLSCASCHQPERAFTDGRARGLGMHTTLRNTPSVISSANYKWFYWDGRRDSLWSQALIPFEAADEMGSSRVAILRIVSNDSDYRQQYETLFGALIGAKKIASLPAHAGPLGNLATRTAWYRIDESLREQINRFYANIGKAIAAYERTLRFQPTRFDRYVAALLLIPRRPGEQAVRFASSLLSKTEIEGLKLYLDDKKTHCRNCHNGRLFSNSEFYDINSAKLAGRAVDYGRALGLDAAHNDPFNCLGPYSDVDDGQKQTKCRLAGLDQHNENTLAIGAFKTPTLRGLIDSAPYFHDGSMESLDDVLRHYLNAGSTHSPSEPGVDIQFAKQAHDLEALHLNAGELRSLLAFLMSLSI